MKIAKDIRAIEAHIKSISTDKATQLALISKAQGMAIGSGEYNMAVLCIAKNRIYKTYQPSAEEMQADEEYVMAGYY
jgi:hypothetical protein